MTTDDFDRIWSEVEWRDLNPTAPGFNEALRHRFARAIIAQARAEALEEAAQVCIDHSERCDDNREHATAIACSRKIRAIIPTIKEGHE